MSSSVSSPLCSRRQFLSSCAACAGCAATGSLFMPKTARAANTRSVKPVIRVVFCETTNDKPIWPNIGYDFVARRKQLLDTLQTGCPNLKLVHTTILDQPDQAAQVVAKDAEVDGYIVCVQGLGWRNDIVKLCETGKPTLLVDNLYGGSGLFLTRLSQIMASGKPVDWISSRQDTDVVAVARQFAKLTQGASAAEVAAAFRKTRRDNTAVITQWDCLADEVPTPDFQEAFERLRSMKLLVIGGGWGGDAFRAAARELVGLQFVALPFEQLSERYAMADRDRARQWADRWIDEAEEVVEPTREDVDKAAAMYVAMDQLMKERDAIGISVNCLGGFYGGHLQAYPCLGFCQLNNDGQVGGCEADQMSALTMAVMGALVGRPGFISDPVIDTSRGEIIYAHCVAMTRPFGRTGAANPYRIRSHSEDRKGASMQSLLPSGYMTTTLEINPVAKRVLMHQAKTTGNDPNDMACRTKLRAAVKGDLEKLAENWSMGWHRVTFYGDLKEPVEELCGRLKLELVEEA